MTRSVHLGFRLLIPWLGALAVLTAFQRALSGTWLLLSGAVAAALGCGLAALGHRRRWPLPVTAAAVALGVAVLVAVFGRSASQAVATPSPSALARAAAALVSGWTDVLSTATPLPREPATAAVVLLTVALAAWAGAEVTLRSSNPLHPALVQTPFLVVAEMIAAPEPYDPLAAVIFAVVLIIGVLAASATVPAASADPPDGAVGDTAPTVGRLRARARLLAGVAAGAAALAAGAGLAGATAETRMRDPFDPRDLSEPAVEEASLIHPLTRLQSELTGPEREVFVLSAVVPAAAGPGGMGTPAAPATGADADGDTGAEPGADAGADTDTAATRPVGVRLVALDTYDGSSWNVPSSASRAVDRLPTGDAADNGVLVDQRITVRQLGSPWLPSLGWPVRLQLEGDDRANFDDEVGNLLAEGGGLADGANYRLSANLVLATDAELQAGDTSGADERWVALPGGATDLLRPLVESLETTGTPYQRLEGLAGVLRRSYAYDVEHAPAGHSLGQLRRFLSGEINGSAEHFATTFALAARQLGFPSRVVVGYRVPADQLAGTPVAVTSRAAHAWPEVHFDGIGWVPFEPTPERTQSVPPREPAPEPTLTSSVAGAAAPDEPLDSNRIEDQPEVTPDDPLPLWQRVLLGVAAALALVALLAGSVVGAKAARRRRRRRGDATRQVVGAWAEARDRLGEHGVTVPGGATAGEVADASRERLGDDAARSLADLAPLVGAAVYDPRGAAPDMPAAAWAAVTDLRVELRRRAGVGGATRAALDPRSLRRHRTAERSRGRSW